MYLAASSARKRDSGCITPDIHNGGGADLSEDVDRGTPCARVWEPVDRLNDFSAAATSAAQKAASRIAAIRRGQKSRRPAAAAAPRPLFIPKGIPAAWAPLCKVSSMYVSRW